MGSGASLAFATFPRVRFAWLAGEAAVLRSSAAVVRRFCGRCGSPLIYEAAADPALLDVKIGSLDAPDDFRPTCHVRAGEKIAWDVVADGLPIYDGARGT